MNIHAYTFINTRPFAPFNCVGGEELRSRGEEAGAGRRLFAESDESRDRERVIAFPRAKDAGRLSYGARAFVRRSIPASRARQ